MHLALTDVRRLTGPNLLWNNPGAIIDVEVEGPLKAALASWQKWSRTLLDEFCWDDEQQTFRLFDGGASFAISAPIDALYTACDLTELIWQCCCADLTHSAMPDWPGRLEELTLQRTAEANPALLALVRAASQHHVTCLTDDDEVSLGMGSGVDVWPVTQLPDLAAIVWSKYHDIPRALITGTNGKSTSVRLAARIAKAAQFTAGVTSTDFIRVGENIIEEGDFSGPGGARMLLRDPRTEIAFLEVARGGILRRGLPVLAVNAALITNVASDHLGQYGINTVDELAEVKFVVAKALHGDAVLVVNADNALVVQQARNSKHPLCWFSQDENNFLIQQQLSQGGRAVFVSAGTVTYCAQGQCESIMAIEQIAMTFNGTAEHNIQNALGVVGLCKALNLPVAAIQQGLAEFGSDPQDNPGRGNRYQINGVEVIVDFAHNEHSMRAVVGMVKKIPAKRRFVMFSHAGDRSDQEIKHLTAAVADLGAHAYLVAEVEKYLRGRNLGDISLLSQRYLMDLGITAKQVCFVPDALSGSKQAMEMAQSGDVVLLFVLDNRQQVHDWLSSL
ncbi:MAG: cyanophycin synthetase [Paraglaciecola sp.]|jgi:cyanophycin synthetase